MKADVQYNDFLGTSASDISDHGTLESFIKERGVDTNRFLPVGVEFYSSYSDYFSASIICEDKERSKEDEKFLVGINFEQEITKDDFFDLFKRLNVVLIERFGGYQNLEVKEVFTHEVSQ